MEEIQDSSLQTYLAALKVEYQQNPRSYNLILQDIAAEVASHKESYTPGVQTVSAAYTHQGTCPKQSVHKPDGSVFIGNYPSNQLLSDSVKPHHIEILKACSKGAGGDSNGNGGGWSRNGKCKANALKRGKREIKKLKAKLKISAAKLEEAGISLDNEENDNADNKDDGQNKAGNAFGGKHSKRS